MKRQYLTAILIFGALPLFGQDLLPMSNPPDPAHNVASLYKRASASRFVAVGTVVDGRSVMSRKERQYLNALLAAFKEGKERPKPDPDPNTIGHLYTIRLEQILCRQSDFQASLSQSLAPDPNVIYIFVPFDGNLQPYVERPKTNERDLLFLVTPAGQKQWIEEYDLDRDQTYYQAMWRGEGVISLSEPGESPPILDKMTQLCQAVQPADPAQKIAALDKLAASGDPVLQKEAAEAKKSLAPSH
jgi:hypothetical protein